MSEDKTYDILQDASEVAARAVEEPEDRDLTQIEKAKHGPELIDEMTLIAKRHSANRALIEAAALSETVLEIPFNVPGNSRYTMVFFNAPSRGLRRVSLFEDVSELSVRVSGKQDEALIVDINFKARSEAQLKNQLHGLLRGQKLLGRFKTAIGM